MGGGGGVCLILFDFVWFCCCLDFFVVEEVELEGEGEAGMRQTDDEQQPERGQDAARPFQLVREDGRPKVHLQKDYGGHRAHGYQRPAQPVPRQYAQTLFDLFIFLKKKLMIC